MRQFFYDRIYLEDTIKKQKEKKLNPSKYLDVQDRTRTGCLRSLYSEKSVPDPPQAHNAFSFCRGLLYTRFSINPI